MTGDRVDGFFNDDGRAFEPDLIAKPDLCVSCAKDGAPKEEVPCALTRADQRGEDVFLCFGYVPASPDVDRAAVLRDLCERAGVEFDEGDAATADGEGPISF